MARVEGFVAGMKTAQQAASDFASRTAKFAKENEEHFDRVGKASAVLGGALVAGAVLAVKSFMEFDSAMAAVKASTHETAANMDLLREAAINAGADTAFSAKEAAQGIDELAKAGVSTKDILGGGLAGALSLAAAGSLEVGDAAEIAATALTQFKLSGQDIPHLADLLAAGAGKAQGSVEDIGNALKQSGLVASQFGLSVEDTTGTLAAFASAGLTGSDSGTSFKTMLLSLANPAAKTQSLMSELGISAYDAQDKFVGITNLAEQLKTKLGGLGQAQRDAALAQIFGTDAIRGANVLYEQGAAGIQGWIEKVNEAGYAAVTASIKQDTLAGDLEKLGGSFDSVLIKGGGAAAEALRGIVQGAEGLVDAIGKIPGPVLNAAVGIAGVTGGALLLGGAFLTVLPRLVEFKSSLDQIAPKGSRAGSAIRGVGKAAAIATVALVGLQVVGAIFSDKQTKSAEDFGQALLKVQKISGTNSGKGLDSMFQGWDKIITGETVSTVNDLSSAVERLTHQGSKDWIDQNLADPLNRLLGFSVSDVAQIQERFKGLGEEMGNITRNGGADTAAKSFQALTAEFQKNGQGAKEALAAVPGYKDALQGLANQAGVTLSEQDLLDFAMGKVPDSMLKAGGSVETYTTKVGNSAPMTEAMSKALEDVGLSASGAVTDIEKFTQSLFNAGMLSLSASDATIAYEAAIDAVTESVTKNGKTLDVHTEQGRANQTAYNDMAKAAMTVAEATAAETLKTQGSAAAQATLQAGLSQSYKDLITAAGQFGITGDAADDMARKALGIPKNVNIDAWIADHASTTLDGIKGKADGLDGKRVTIGIYTTEYFNRVDQRSAPTVVDPNQLGGHYATGGRVTGPGTSTSDDVPAWLSNDEYVLTAAAARKIGYGNLDRMNGGDVSPIKPMGYEYSPAGAPAVTHRAPMVAAAPQQTPPVYVQNPFTGAYLLAQVDSRAAGVVGAADSGSQFMRKGRG
jgi:TP901 family phage tail tape measure protein